VESASQPPRRAHHVLTDREILVTVENECGSKRPYPNKAEAKRAEAHTRTAVGGPKGHAYRCGWCGWIHVGHGRMPLDSPRRALIVKELRKTMSIPK
jgi:hypothetical protein